ncbi:MAG: hypothetical protein GX589_01585 [Deltaproteobacteria bacterium]|nr:hypothetical protein [Deltaproteobacteria bacterium]
MTGAISEEAYALIYEGEADERLETLQKIKGVFIADLDLSIPRVKEILDKKPITVVTAADKDTLNPAYQALLKAGAKVAIVQQQSSAADPENDEKTDELGAPLGPESKEQEDKFDFFSDHEPTNFREQHADEIAASFGEEAPLTIALDLNIPAAPSPEPDLKQLTPDTATSLQADTATELSLEIKPDESDDLNQSLLSPQQVEASKQKIRDSMEKKSTLLDQEQLFEFEDSPAETKVPNNPQVNEVLDLDSSLSLSIAPVADEVPSSDLVQDKQKISDSMEKELTLLDQEQLFEFEDAPAKTTAPNDPLVGEILDLDSSLSLSIAPVADETPSSDPVQDEMAHLLEDEPLELDETDPLSVADPVQDQTEPLMLSEQALNTASTSLEDVPPQQPEPNQVSSPLKPLAHGTAASTPAPCVDTFSTRKPSRQKLSISWDLLAPILVGAVVLLIGNWYFFFSHENAKETLQPHTRNTANKPKADERMTPMVEQIEMITLKGQSSGEGVDDSLELRIVDGKVVNATLSITTTPPPELTPEEIVTNRQPPPWINKALVQNLSLTQRADGSFSGDGQARIYVDHAGRRHRLLAQITLQGRYNQRAKEASLNYQIDTQPPNPSASGRYEITSSSDGGYTISIRGNLTAKE